MSWSLLVNNSMIALQYNTSWLKDTLHFNFQDIFIHIKKDYICICSQRKTTVFVFGFDEYFLFTSSG